MSSILDELSKWEGLPQEEERQERRCDFSHFSQNSRLGGKEDQAQPTDFEDFPTFPTFPTNSESGASGGEFSTSSPPSASADLQEEQARASSSYQERWESGKANEFKGPWWEKWEKWENDPGFLDLFEERAAIREFDGGYSREEAEALAREECRAMFEQQPSNAH